MIIRFWLQFTTLIFLASCYGSSARSSSLQHKLGPITELVPAPSQFGWGPFEDLDRRLDNTPLKKYVRGLLPLDAALSQSLHDGLLHSDIALRHFLTTKSASTASGGSLVVHEFRLQYSGVPLCEAYVKSIEAPGQLPVVNGEVPLVDQVEQVSEEDWPSLEHSTEKLKDSLAALHFALQEEPTTRLLRSSRCYFVMQGTLRPAWEMVMSFNGLPYLGFSDGNEIFSAEPRFFDVQGSVQAYKANPVNGELKTYTIELTGNGTLTSEFFTTSPESVSRSSSSDHKFIYAASDQRFAEAAVFAYTNMQYEFFKSLGYEWGKIKPMTLKIHATIDRSVNNALYQPADSTDSGLPTISVGDGDGAILQNLPYDSDVVSHEFGHHVVYDTLKSTKGESLILHEGLADFFAFARSGDDCLGESICPSGSSVCYVKNKCLRSAGVTLKYTDDAYSKVQLHQKGQVISGMLVDMKKSGNISESDLNALVFKSLAYLTKSASLQGFAKAVLNADKAFYSGKYADVFLSAAKGRGLDEVVSGINLAEINGALPAADSEDTTSSSSSSKTSKKNDDFFSCTMGTHYSSGGQVDALFWLLITAIPLLLLVPRRKPAYVPIPKRAPQRKKE